MRKECFADETSVAASIAFDEVYKTHRKCYTDMQQAETACAGDGAPVPFSAAEMSAQAAKSAHSKRGRN